MLGGALTPARATAQADEAPPPPALPTATPAAAAVCPSQWCGGNFGGFTTPSGMNFVLAPGSGATDLWDNTTKIKYLRFYEGAGTLKAFLTSTGTSFLLGGPLAIGGTDAGGFLLSVKGGSAPTRSSSRPAGPITSSPTTTG